MFSPIPLYAPISKPAVLRISARIGGACDGSLVADVCIHTTTYTFININLEKFFEI
jgi:hypothetical protein